MQKPNYQFDREIKVVFDMIKLNEIKDEHLHLDELAGYHYVIPKEKLDAIIESLSDKIETLVKTKSRRNGCENLKMAIEKMKA